MTPKLPTDKEPRYGYYNKEYLDHIEKREKKKTEARRYWTTTAISILALIVALIALFR